MMVLSIDPWSLRKILLADLYRQHELTHGKDSPLPNGWKIWLTSINPRFIPVFLCRVSHSFYLLRLTPIAKVFAFLNFFIFGLEVSVQCSIGPGLFLPHTHGTVIGAWRIGKNATIFQGVTLGAKELDFSYTFSSRPTLGDNVIIGAGAKVLGGINISDLVRVGANSVVLSNIPRGALAVGAPARIVNFLQSSI